VFGNIANPLRLRGFSAAKIAERVISAAKLLEIDHLLNRRPQELSSGQKQRVAIGRAIVREPKLFLFYVTHDLLEALSMADMMVVMHHGELQQWGTPREIFNHPVNAWVAGFVGEPAMNFLTCELRDEGSQTILTHPSFAIPLLPEQVTRLGSNRSVRMGVRPDALTIDTTRPGGPVIEGRIFVTELLGGDIIVNVQLDDARVRVKTSTEFAGQPDDACYLTVNRDNWHLFDIDDGHAFSDTYPVRMAAFLARHGATDVPDIFHAVRNLPYHSSGERSPDAVMATGRGACTAKAYPVARSSAPQGRGCGGGDCRR